jgi:hypothetical protein
MKKPALERLAFANKKASGLSEALSGFRGDRRDLVRVEIAHNPSRYHPIAQFIGHSRQKKQRLVVDKVKKGSTPARSSQQKARRGSSGRAQFLNFNFASS